MSRLGQLDFLDYGDWSTDVFDWGAVDADWGWDADLSDAAFGMDENYLYDYNAADTIGYDVADPFYTTQYGGDEFYNPNLTMPDDYGDLYAPQTYGASEFDPATGIGIGDAIDWSAWEVDSSAELESSFGGDVDSAVASFAAEFPDVSWDTLVADGMNIYALYQKLQQPAGAATGPKPSLMRDPRTGQMIPAVRDPRTGKMVPAMRDPRTGQLVPASNMQAGGGLIPGVPNEILALGVGIAAFLWFR